jgi:hypothetical protein
MVDVDGAYFNDNRKSIYIENSPQIVTIANSTFQSTGDPLSGYTEGVASMVVGGTTVYHHQGYGIDNFIEFNNVNTANIYGCQFNGQIDLEHLYEKRLPTGIISNETKMVVRTNDQCGSGGQNSGFHYLNTGIEFNANADYPVHIYEQEFENVTRAIYIPDQAYGAIIWKNDFIWDDNIIIDDFTNEITGIIHDPSSTHCSDALVIAENYFHWLSALNTTNEFFATKTRGCSTYTPSPGTYYPFAHKIYGNIYQNDINPAYTGNVVIGNHLQTAAEVDFQCNDYNDLDYDWAVANFSADQVNARNYFSSPARSGVNIDVLDGNCNMTYSSASSPTRLIPSIRYTSSANPISITSSRTCGNGFSNCSLYYYGTDHAALAYMFYDITISAAPVFLSVAEPDTEEMELRIYPNPARSYVTITFSSRAEDGEGEIEIIDQLGRKVLVDKINLRQGDGTATLGISHLKPGLYSCRLTSNGSQLIKKLVVN